VFTAGTLMESLWAALPPDRRGGAAPTAVDLKQAVVADVRPGDIVMVKGSNSIRMALIVQALRERYGADQEPTQACKG